MTNAPYHWIKKITSSLDLTEVPLFGSAPPFDLKKFSEKLREFLGIENFSLHLKERALKNGPEILEGLGNDLITFCVHISPIGKVKWVLNQADMQKISLAMMKSTDRTSPPPSEIIQKGFYHYLLLESLSQISKVPPFNAFTFELDETEETADEAFCIDVEITLNQKVSWARLILPKEFQRKWAKHFENANEDYVPTDAASKISLSLIVKTGSISLTAEQFEKVKKGDFILLDKGGYDAHKKTGTATLLINSIPLFQVKIKNNKIELIDYAFYYEDNMDNSLPPETPEPSEFEEGTSLSKEPESVGLKQLPLEVIVEVARIKMTLEKLMQLTPGNVLELPIHPDQAVSLTVNGAKVGKGELVYLGERLGIRIVEL